MTFAKKSTVLGEWDQGWLLFHANKDPFNLPTWIQRNEKVSCSVLLPFETEEEFIAVLPSRLVRYNLGLLKEPQSDGPIVLPKTKGSLFPAEFRYLSAQSIIIQHVISIAILSRGMPGVKITSTQRRRTKEPFTYFFLKNCKQWMLAIYQKFFPVGRVPSFLPFNLTALSIFTSPLKTRGNVTN